MKPTLKLKLVIPADLVDRYCELQRAHDDFAAKEREYQKTKTTLRLLLADEDPEAAFTAAGNQGALLISPATFESTLDVAAVRKKLGAAMFLEVASVTKKALENVLLKPEIDALCVESQTGPRKYELIPLKDAA